MQIRVRARRYPVDYDWAKTHGGEQDYCLVGRLRGSDITAAVDGIHAALARCEHYPGSVDGVPVTASVDGGIRAYARPAPDGLDLFLHSSGEDAAEALSEFSGVLARAARKPLGTGTLTWEPLPADRRDRHFSFGD